MLYQILVSKCHSRELSCLDPEADDDDSDDVMSDFYLPSAHTGAPRVTMTTAIVLVNQCVL